MKPKHLDNLFSILALAAWLFCTDCAFSQPTYQVPVGTRPRSMGEAFVAVADDGNAIFWNPAGLAPLEQIQLNYSYADMFGLGINGHSLSFFTRAYFIPPLTDYLSFGVMGSHLGTLDTNPESGQEDFGFAQDQVYLALAFRPPQRSRAPVLRELVYVLRHLSLGATAKFLQIDSRLDSKPEADAKGWGADAGMLYDLGALPHVLNGLHLGLMVHDAIPTQVTHDTKSKEEILPRNFRWGLSYRPFELRLGGKFPLSDPVLAFDFDDRVHFGLEFWLYRKMAIRAGVQKDRHTDEPAIFSFGLGLKADVKNGPQINFDYAATDWSSPLPNTTKQFGGALIMKDNPRLIRIEEAYIDNLFASLYKHYGHPAGAIGVAKLHNLHHDTLAVEVSFVLPPFTEQEPLLQTAIIPPQQSVELPVQALFNRNILFCSPEERVSGRIEAAYHLPYRGLCRTVKTVDFMLYGRGYLTWEDAGKAAAFVTSRDESVRDYAHQVRLKNSFAPGDGLHFTTTMIEAMRQFEALHALGFNYGVDPKTSYALVKNKKYAVDRIFYPAEFLQSTTKTGDCDDLAVLYATVLEVLGIETALLSTPTHLFMMFNTGIPAQRWSGMAVDTTRFVTHRNMLWLPVETAVGPRTPFMQAWALGSAKYRAQLARQALAIFEVAGEQSPERYPPADVFFTNKYSGTVPEVKAALSKNLSAFADTARAFLQKLEEDLARHPENAGRRNAYAVILGQNGERQKARAHFEILLQQDPQHAAALNNLANIEFVEGNFTQAEALFLRANRHNAFNPAGTYLNLAFLYEMMIDYSKPESVRRHKPKMVQAFHEAGRWLSRDSDLAAYLLGLPRAELQGKGDPGQEQSPRAVASDTLRAETAATPKQPVAAPPLSRKGKSLTSFIKAIMQALLEGQPPEDAVLDRAGGKGSGEVDEDRAWLLWWSI